ncbi:unnamed protein product [Schistosoma turkestanicum]|nr:unnamed protein product [Schistosoma turkestanicum]
MSVGNKKQPHISSSPTDRDVPRVPVLPNRTSARSWRKREPKNKDIKKLSKDPIHVKTCSTKYQQQNNQRRLANVVPSVSTSQLPLKSVNEKDTKYLNVGRITNSQTDVKPFHTYTSTAANSTHNLKRAIIRKDEKDFPSNFEKNNSIHEYNLSKSNNNCHINKPDYKYTLSMTTVKPGVVKKMSFNQSDHSKSSNCLSSSENQISSWLIQRNNTSTTLNKKGVKSDQKAIGSGQRGNFNSCLSSHSFIKQSNETVHCSAKKIDSDKQQSNEEVTCVSNELNTNSSKYSKTNLIDRIHETVDESTEVVSNEHLIDNEPDENINSNPVKYYDVNSTNLTDWGSVSSSEWGDDMCFIVFSNLFEVTGWIDGPVFYITSLAS